MQNTDKIFSIITEERALNRDISAIVALRLPFVQIHKLKQLREKHTSLRALAQIDYYIRKAAEKIQRTFFMLFFSFWLIFLLTFAAYRSYQTIMHFL